MVVLMTRKGIFRMFPAIYLLSITPYNFIVNLLSLRFLLVVEFDLISVLPVEFLIGEHNCLTVCNYRITKNHAKTIFKFADQITRFLQLFQKLD